MNRGAWWAVVYGVTKRVRHNLVTAAAAKSLQSFPTLCDPIDGSPPGFPVPGILQARTLEWIAISFSTESEVTQLCPTLSSSMDCSPPGFSVHGIFQARVMEWVAIAFSILGGTNGPCTLCFRPLRGDGWKVWRPYPHPSLPPSVGLRP